MQTIKELRQKKGINQSELALAIGVSLRTIQLYEKKDANIPIKNLTKIADFFGFSIAELYSREIKEPQEFYYSKNTFAKHGNTIYPLEGGRFVLRAPLLTIKQQKDFLQQIDDTSFINGLEKIGFLLESVDDTFYMAFEVMGNAMNDGTSNAIPNGAVVLGKTSQASRWSKNNLKMGTPYVIVLKNRIVCKAITGFSIENGAMMCHNLNPSPEYRDFEISASEILGLYEIVKKQL